MIAGSRSFLSRYMFFIIFLYPLLKLVKCYCKFLSIDGTNVFSTFSRRAVQSYS